MYYYHHHHHGYAGYLQLYSLYLKQTMFLSKLHIVLSVHYR
jgi:hypothetical protein